jgi:calcineurin-like phosphoesterase family protein
MSRVFFTSDLHFGHENLTRGLRGMSYQDSDYLIIKNWNDTVSKRDTVIILGDITMEHPTYIPEYIKALNGNIKIVGGNHDTKRCVEAYNKLGIPVLGCLMYKGFICTHIPVHPLILNDCRGNIHGHIHLQGTISGYGVYKPEPLEGRYYNVNTEFHNYTPVPFSEIEKYFINYET